MLAAATVPLLAHAERRPYYCPPCLDLSNAFVRADVSPAGIWTLGTENGTWLPEHRRLLYGFIPDGRSIPGSSISTVRVAGPRGVVDLTPGRVIGQNRVGDWIDTVWESTTPYHVRVTESVGLVDNPLSGRPDAVVFGVDARNSDGVPLDIGVRTVLDVRVGDNDGAPYLVPGLGGVTHEREFLGAQVPPYWLAFASPVFDPAELRAAALLRSPGLTPPDRMLIARWVFLFQTDWEYTIQPTQPVTVDSAVALYWQPQTVQPGQSRSVRSQYGVSGAAGGPFFLAGPTQVEPGREFVQTLFVSNFGRATLSGGAATLTLPAGVSLALGESAARHVGDVSPGDTVSLAWQLRVSPDTVGERQIVVSARFAGGQHFEAQTVVHSIGVPSPTATAPAPTVTPVPPTATPEPQPRPGPMARACPGLDSIVPRVVVDAALANPARVGGWLEPENPSLPVGPGNGLKTWLAARNQSAPYHPLFNSLAFKAGCR
jgi:hypothetical protein